MPPVREASTKPSAATVLPAPVACSNQKRLAALGSSGCSGSWTSSSGPPRPSPAAPRARPPRRLLLARAGRRGRGPRASPDAPCRPRRCFARRCRCRRAAPRRAARSACPRARRPGGRRAPCRRRAGAPPRRAGARGRAGATTGAATPPRAAWRPRRSRPARRRARGGGEPARGRFRRSRPRARTVRGRTSSPARDRGTGRDAPRGAAMVGHGRRGSRAGSCQGTAAVGPGTLPRALRDHAHGPARLCGGCDDDPRGHPLRARGSPSGARDGELRRRSPCATKCSATSRVSRGRRARRRDDEALHLVAVRSRDGRLVQARARGPTAKLGRMAVPTTRGNGIGGTARARREPPGAPAQRAL